MRVHLSGCTAHLEETHQVWCMCRQLLCRMDQCIRTSAHTELMQVSSCLHQDFTRFSISLSVSSSSSSVSWLSSSFYDSPFKQFAILSVLDSHRFTMSRTLPTLSLYSSKSLFNCFMMNFFNMQFILHLTFFNKIWIRPDIHNFLQLSLNALFLCVVQVMRVLHILLERKQMHSLIRWYVVNILQHHAPNKYYLQYCKYNI